MAEGRWYADEAFWTVMAPVMFGPKRWAETEAVCAAVEALASARGVPSGGHLLDALCALGRASLEFARRGWKVTGVDLCEAYLRAAREDAEGRGLDLEFIRSDIRSFRGEASYDLAVNLYNSFGYLESREDDLAMLRAIRGALKPGGLLVMEFQGRELVRRDFRESERYESEAGTVLLRSELLDEGSVLRQEWGLERPNGGRFSFPFVQRLYSEAELRSVLVEAGFGALEFFGDLRGGGYGPKADSLVVISKLLSRTLW